MVVSPFPLRPDSICSLRLAVSPGEEAIGGSECIVMVQEWGKALLSVYRYSEEAEGNKI